MQRVLAKQLIDFVGKEVTVRGWMNNIRNLGKINFLILRDRTGFVQIVIEDKGEFAKVKNLQTGSILTIKALVQETQQTDLKVELTKPQIHVEVEVKEVAPIEYSKPDIMQTLRQFLTIELYL
jgi:nondiscriminating aspartyl-tRNA synthetase